MPKKPKITCPFEPFVDVFQALDYNARTNENPTPSRFINQVMYAIQVLHLKSAKDVAAYLELTPAQVSRTVEVVTGYTFEEIRLEWVKMEAERLRAAHPEWNNDELAQALGYANRAALWNVTHPEAREAFNKERRELRRAWRAKRW